MSPTISTTQTNKLQLKLEKIEVMKWLLNLEEQDIDISQVELQKQIDEIAYENFTFLPVLISHFDLLPPKMQISFDKFLLCRDNNSYSQCFKQFSKYVEENKEYQEYSMYLLTDIARYSTRETDSLNTDYLLELLLQTKQVYHVLIFNIVQDLCGEVFKYPMNDVIYTYPLLYKWIKDNKYKPIDNLTNDDCEVIAGLFYGLKTEEMLGLNLSSLARNIESVKEISQQLPTKLHVNNITQVIFRVLLLKPFLWSLPSHEDIVVAIKGVKDVLPRY